MKTWIHLTLAFATGIVVYDALASYVSLGTGIGYAWFSLGSMAIYYVASLLVSRYRNIRFGVLAASFVGFVEATFGWVVSYLIGPGNTGEQLSIPLVIFVIFFVAVSAGLIGLFGALTGTYVLQSK